MLNCTSLSLTGLPQSVTNVPAVRRRNNVCGCLPDWPCRWQDHPGVPPGATPRARGGGRRPVSDGRCTKPRGFLDEEEVDSGIVVSRGREVRFWHLAYISRVPGGQAALAGLLFDAILCASGCWRTVTCFLRSGGRRSWLLSDFLPMRALVSPRSTGWRPRCSVRLAPARRWRTKPSLCGALGAIERDLRARSNTKSPTRATQKKRWISRPRDLRRQERRRHRLQRPARSRRGAGPSRRPAVDGRQLDQNRGGRVPHGDRRANRRRS